MKKGFDKMEKVNYKLNGGGLFTNEKKKLSNDWREYYLISNSKGASYGI